MSIFARLEDKKHVLSADPAVTVTIRSLSLGERAKIATLAGEMGRLAGECVTDSQIPEIFDAILRICRIGIREISGPGVPPGSLEEILSSIMDPGVLSELAMEVIAHNQLRQEEEKNSNGGCERSGRDAPAPCVPARKNRSSAKPPV